MTKNLLAGNLDEAGIQKILARHSRKPLLPDYSSEQWSAAAKNLLVRQLAKPLRELAEKECGEPMPELTDELYSSFRKTGIRLTFERVYFERRRRLARAMISLLLCGADDPLRDRLKESTVAKLTSVFEEVSWSLPAHVHWHEKDNFSGKDPFQIDLFCAETANLMAESLDMLGDIVPDGLRARIRERLLRTIFENFANEENSWRFGWKQATHNWNAVCHQGVVGAALSQLDDNGLLAKILASAKAGLPFFLSGFGNDGGCSEGPGYWSYGFGWFTVLNEQLETRTSGELSLFEGDEHVRVIAHYGPRVTLTGGNLVNFSDNGATGSVNPALLTYLGARLREPEFGSLSCESYAGLLKKGFSLNGERTDVFYLGRLLLRCPEDVSEGAAFVRKDCFLPDLAVAVARGTDRRGHLWEFAAKAGHNAEHHNHNDCGSFILNIDGKRAIIEIGAPEYVHGFFSPDTRYTYLAARSLGHSVPLVNGCEQAAGAEFISTLLRCDLGNEQTKFVADITKCYPAEARCRKLVRTFLFDKPQGVLRVDDDFELETAGLVESVIICETPVTHERSVVKIHCPDFVLQINPREGTIFSGVEACSYSDHGGHEQQIQRLRFRPAKEIAAGTIGYSISIP